MLERIGCLSLDSAPIARPRAAYCHPVAPVEAHPIDVHREERRVLKQVLVLRELHSVRRTVRALPREIRDMNGRLQIR